MGAINVYFEGRTLEEVRQQIRASGILGDEATLIMPPVTPDPVEPDPQPEVTSAPVTQEDVTADPAPAHTLVSVRAAANAYRDKHGIEALREIFKKHGGEKLKDIPEKNYDALMQEIA